MSEEIKSLIYLAAVWENSRRYFEKQQQLTGSVYNKEIGHARRRYDMYCKIWQKMMPDSNLDEFHNLVNEFIKNIK